MRAAPICLWVLLILAVFLVAHKGHWGVRGMISMVALPQDTLLLPGASTPERFAMRYVRTEGGVPAGATVDFTKLARQPVLPVLPVDRVLAAVPVARSEVQQGLNAGRAAQICHDAAALGSVTIVAIRCDSAAANTCTGIVSIRLGAGALLQALGKPDGLRLAPAC